MTADGVAGLGREVPQSNGPVPRAGRDSAAVGANRNCSNTARVTRQYPVLRPVVAVALPYPNGAVKA